MFRFLSGRKARNNNSTNTNGTNDNHHIRTTKNVQNKNLIQCKVILLDNTDLSIELSVSIL